jgi:hypothetical protein
MAQPLCGTCCQFSTLTREYFGRAVRSHYQLAAIRNDIRYAAQAAKQREQIHHVPARISQVNLVEGSLRDACENIQPGIIR